MMKQYEGRKVVIQLEREEGLKEGVEKGKLEGKKEGLEEGKKEGLEEGKLKEKREIAKNLKSVGIEIESISKATGLSTEEINSL
ncbi:MAG: hypothetical protein H7263_07340 [Candidatus Sericytochromatia bacterium]|nr:hypothetical protein [Candidatus Sericytochromatia bacterium]